LEQCIDQNDKDNKHMQVSMMDLIYSQAYLTIVAATGAEMSTIKPIKLS
jgi:hypothetical protein